MTEFELIKQYFASQTEHRADVRIGIGDDTALVNLPAGHELAITTDTLVAGVHFPIETHAYDIGYKSLAVNLSDLAAMGASPAWVTLAITLPNADENWIQDFCNGFFTLANRYQVQLIGGDLTHGPLSITVQALGHVQTRQALLRSAAQPGDLIYVTGTLGDAGMGLAIAEKRQPVQDQDVRSYLLSRLNRPEPRVLIGTALLKIANSAIDISDGLVADLSHILKASKVGAKINVDALPLSPELIQTLKHEDAVQMALTSGDDYELCFTVPPNKAAALETELTNMPCRITCIGSITNSPTLDLHNKDGKPYHGSLTGYQHF